MKKKVYFSKTYAKFYNILLKFSFLRQLKILLYYFDSFVIMFYNNKKNIKKFKKKKVLIIYNMALGDGVIWRCSSRILRKIYSTNIYEITLICQKGLERLYSKDEIYDKIIPLDFNKATMNIKIRWKVIKEIRKEFYDIILDPIGIAEYTTNVLMVKVARGKEKIGVIDTTLNLKHSDKINKIYTKIIKINKPNLSLIEFYSEFVNKLSKTPKTYNVEFIKNIVTKPKYYLPKKYYIMFPSASTNLKRWPLKRYAEIAHKVYNKTNLTLVLCGTNSDSEVLETFKKLISDIPYIDMSKKTSLSEYIGIIKNAVLIITNDTSAYHIAVIEETPTAIITGGYTYDRYVAYDFKTNKKYKKPYIIVHKKPCFNCDNKCKYLKSSDTVWPCLNEISEEYAWKIIKQMIDDNKLGVSK